MSSTEATNRGVRKTRRGEVISAAMEKTVVVRVVRTYRHPRYGKVVKQAKLFKAHDEKKEARLGDIVEIMETRPLSKTKRWRVVAVLKASAAVAMVEI